jgi:hypothetical protein
MIMAHDDCPLLQTQPETIEEVLRWCLINRDMLPAIGRQGRLYVEKHHSIEAVAGRLAKLYSESPAFSEIMQARFHAFILRESSRQAALVGQHGWQHPFSMSTIGRQD